MTFLEALGRRAAMAGRRVVLAEGHDERVGEAAVRLQEAGHLDVALILADASAGSPVGWKGELIRPRVDARFERYVELYAAKQNVVAEDAREQVADPLHFAGLMVAAGDADGAVAGADHSTAQVVRAALRSLGTAPGTRLVSGAFYMVVPAFRGSDGPEVLTFADSGVVPDPEPDQLAEIAAQAARMRRAVVGDEPRVAFLSFSTRGSAEAPAVLKMRRAQKLFREAYPDVAADGELQADAALIRAVGQRKAPDSPVAGHANVLIFPDLGAGNIAYKLVERLAGATAIGPILHGLARPYNDLSRGADARSIEYVAYVTALMAVEAEPVGDGRLGI